MTGVSPPTDGTAAALPSAGVLRPAVSVVMPFAGPQSAAVAALGSLRSLRTIADDQLILADNSGTAPFGVAETGRRYAAPYVGVPLTIVRAGGEASPSHARNVGAGQALCEWLLFLDADVRPPADLLECFFALPIDPGVGAITGDIAPLGAPRTLAARYGAARNFLGQRSHVMSPFRPRASAANLLVRRAAFEAIGGFTEGIRAAEDTDFCWRLQAAGWRLGFNPDAVVAHAYRESLRALGRQWREYAAGARWLSERYPDFKPDPGLARGVRIALARLGIGAGVTLRADGRASAASRELSRVERLRFLCVQCYLALEEQVGLRMSNELRPARRGGGRSDGRRRDGGRSGGGRSGGRRRDGGRSGS